MRPTASPWVYPSVPQPLQPLSACVVGPEIEGRTRATSVTLWWVWCIKLGKIGIAGGEPGV